MTAGPWTRALVTGATSGIGAALVEQLAASGVDLVVVARDQERLQTLAQRLTAGVDVEVLGADLGDRYQLAVVEQRLGSEQRPIDLLVNNAGYGLVGDFVELSIEQESDVVAVNVTAVHRLAHAAGAAMARRGRGGILNVSSVAGFRPASRAATYGATKSFVTGFSQALAAELGPRGVVVTCLCPGLTRTEFHQRAGYDVSHYPDWVWQEATTVAAAGLRGLAEGKVTVVPGVYNKAASYLMPLVPPAVLRRIDERFRPGNLTQTT
jgi:uncharacterized protein